MTNEEVVTRIKNYLNDNGIKYDFVATKANISYRLFSLMMNGKRKMLADEFINIVNVLHKEPSDFIYEEDKEDS